MTRDVMIVTSIKAGVEMEQVEPGQTSLIASSKHNFHCCTTTGERLLAFKVERLLQSINVENSDK